MKLFHSACFHKKYNLNKSSNDMKGEAEGLRVLTPKLRKSRTPHLIQSHGVYNAWVLLKKITKEKGFSIHTKDCTILTQKVQPIEITRCIYCIMIVCKRNVISQVF